MLSAARFAGIVRDTPLISIDLVVSHKGKVLLGKRTNEPAKAYWFVPGGRICKDEKINKAFYRLSKNELGVHLPISNAQFLGVYEHFYDTNFSEDGDFGTHYVVLAYSIELDEVLSNLPTQQHTEYMWLQAEKIAVHDHVHDHTKAYFKSIYSTI
ncbi:MAG: GDP-mannose mannosyl hydrolase [Gammaproteobacteria bacterium]|nr:GDP-mannose mannosyl hydrolase [Gammaproteobacteria bacterium]PCH64472.1 MAG: GDP-mannose mannosyl hydrolase [Gammaproteobacteria bacterium]